MLYSILIYGSEELIDKRSEDETEVLIARHRALQAELRDKGKLGPFVRLMPTTSAVTLRARQDAAAVTDGPFAETKEQLLGLYLVECATLDEAMSYARMISHDEGAVEVRPVMYSDRTAEAEAREAAAAQ